MRRRIINARHRVLAALAACLIAVGLAVVTAVPASADAGSLDVYIEKNRYTCGPYDSMYCWDFRLHVNPAGWMKNVTIAYLYEVKINGVIQDGAEWEDYEECLYTDGLSCNRWSKMFTKAYAKTASSNSICIKVTGSQRVPGTSTWLRNTAQDCFNTVGVVAARHK